MQYGVADGQLQRLQSDRNTAARLVSGTWRSEHITPILKSLTWLPIRQRIIFKLATLMQNCMNGRVPVYLADDCQLVARRQTRSATAAFLDVPRTSTSLSSRMFSVAGPRTWNSVSITIRTSSLFYTTSTRLLKTHRGTAAPVTYELAPYKYSYYLTNAIRHTAIIQVYLL